MKKEAQIILLPTTHNSGLDLRNDKLHIEDKAFTCFNGQFYYVLSDLDIQEGDWVFYLISNSIYQITNKYTLEYFNTRYPDNWKKIIATNDESLNEIAKGYTFTKLYPQLSQQGLELLCKLYNEKKELKVMVEYEEKYLYPDGNLSKISRLAPNAIPVTVLKVDSQNCISISEVEEDVEKLADNWVLSNSPNRNIRTDGDLATGFVAGYKAAKQSKE